MIPTCGKFTGDHCRAVRHHMVKLRGSAAFRDCHGILVSADTGGDLRRSRDLNALNAESAIIEAWIPKVAHNPMQSDELGLCATFDPPHLLKRAARALHKDGIRMQGELSYGVVQELHTYCSEPNPHLPFYPGDK